MIRVKLTYGTSTWERFEIVSQRDAGTASENLMKILRGSGDIRVNEQNPFARWEAPDGRFVEARLIQTIGS